VVCWQAIRRRHGQRQGRADEPREDPSRLPRTGLRDRRLRWWQGNKDQNAVHAARYEQNLARLIPSLRKDYNAPNAKFVLATGCGFTGREGFGLQISEAQLAIADAKKHPSLPAT